MIREPLHWTPDYRRQPQTDDFCAYCQRDLKPGQKRRLVHIVMGGCAILHSEDERFGQPIADDPGDMLCYPIGADCARKIGLEWSREVAQ